ncbi:MAG: epimerase [Gemmatimonadota bacterium]|nr:epimerase [Gemmatimonadota bacterium]MDZ4864251.1 epimerase [Gemmatimonadota bacterium]
MNVIIFGASGMVGAGALLECLADPRVTSVLVIGRTGCGVTHPQLTEILHHDFFDYTALQPRLAGLDACLFCLGVSAAGMDEAKYHHLTYDLTLAAARALRSLNPGLTFCYISGAGTDSTERGRNMWARVKDKTENALLALPFKAAFMFRPGYIQPMKGVQTKVTLYKAVYAVLSPLYPILRRLSPRSFTTSVNVGRALINVVDRGYPRNILVTDDINRAAES